MNSKSYFRKLVAVTGLIIYSVCLPSVAIAKDVISVVRHLQPVTIYKGETSQAFLVCLVHANGIKEFTAGAEVTLNNGSSLIFEMKSDECRIVDGYKVDIFFTDGVDDGIYSAAVFKWSLQK